jgi:hypothetical protein
MVANVKAEIIKSPRQAPSIKYSGQWFFKTSDMLLASLETLNGLTFLFPLQASANDIRRRYKPANIRSLAALKSIEFVLLVRVIPAKTGIQKASKFLDSGSR